MKTITRLYQKILSLLLLAVMVFTLLPATAAAESKPSDTVSMAAEAVSTETRPDFTDLLADSELYPYVRYLSDKGIISGFTDGSFRADEPLTRAEAAKMVVLAKELSASDVEMQTFSDVQDGYWAYGAIETAAKDGLFNGLPDGTFRPDDNVTRAEAAVLLIRLSGGTLTDDTIEIKDVSSDYWAYRQAATAINAGLMELSSDGMFCPEEEFSRDEMARSLVVLFSIGPALRSCVMTGELIAKSTEVSVNGIAVEGSVTVGAGDVIVTGAKGKAEISYSDGSGFLINPNTEISITTSEGLNYMKEDGSEGVTVNKLIISLKTGSIFGALSSRYTADSSTIADSAVSEKASGEYAANWWDEPFLKRTRIEVIKPVGVTEVKGTFWMEILFGNWTTSQDVYSNQSSTVLLEGCATVYTTDGFVSLSPGQSTTIYPTSLTPSTPISMNLTERIAFQNVQDWVLERAQAIQDNLPPDLSSNTSQTSDIIGLISDALDEVERQISSLQDVTESPGSNESSVPTISGPSSVSLTAGYSDSSEAYTFGGSPSPAYGIDPTQANTANATFSGTTLTIPSGLSAGSYTVTLTATNSAGTVTKIVTVNVAAALTAPIITGLDSIDLAVGYDDVEQEYTIGGNPVPTLTITANTAGATLSGNTLTIPAGLGAGSYSVTLEAANSAGTVAKTVTVNVSSPPTIEGPDEIDLTEGYVEYQQVYTFGGNPAPTEFELTEPNTANAVFDAATGTLTIPAGLPASDYPYYVTIKATSTAGTEELTICVYVTP